MISFFAFQQSNNVGYKYDLNLNVSHNSLINNLLQQPGWNIDLCKCATRSIIITISRCKKFILRIGFNNLALQFPFFSLSLINNLLRQPGWNIDLCKCATRSIIITISRCKKFILRIGFINLALQFPFFSLSLINNPLQQPGWNIDLCKCATRSIIITISRCKKFILRIGFINLALQFPFFSLSLINNLLQQPGWNIDLCKCATRSIIITISRCKKFILRIGFNNLGLQFPFFSLSLINNPLQQPGWNVDLCKCATRSIIITISRCKKFILRIGFINLALQFPFFYLSLINNLLQQPGWNIDLCKCATRSIIITISRCKKFILRIGFINLALQFPFFSLSLINNLLQQPGWNIDWHAN
ncbi:hypothetical protein J6590_011974 [Homalodisca vitripennis]|nr:hypothetical protein J6590_011974 [Homalodisca vitripennis]